MQRIYKNRGLALLGALTLALLGLVALTVGAGSVAALQAAGDAPDLSPRSQAALSSSGAYYLLDIGSASQATERLTNAVDNIEFVFDKKVMLRAQYDQTQSCDTATDSLTVNYGVTVTYCYIISNTGTTTLTTHFMVDDKLGSLGPLNYTLPPGSGGGLIGNWPYPLTQDLTNIATWRATDVFGATLSKTDKVTVKVVIPDVFGYMFYDTNGDGIRQASENSGPKDGLVRLKQSGTVLRETKTTAPVGYYQILDVIPGDYAVAIDVPVGYVPTSPTEVAVRVTSGQDKLVSFGIRQAPPTVTPTATPTVTPTPTETATPSVTPTPTETATPTATVPPTPTPTETAVPSLTPTETATATPAPTATPTATPTPTETPHLFKLWLPVIYCSSS